jgi:hypothetical protein
VATASLTGLKTLISWALEWAVAPGVRARLDGCGRRNGLWWIAAYCKPHLFAAFAHIELTGSDTAQAEQCGPEILAIAVGILAKNY